MKDKHMRLITGTFLLAGLLAAPFASAQVFKCTEADGKTVYSQAPCTKADNKEKVVKLNDAPMTDGPSAGNSAAYGASNNGGGSNGMGGASGADNSSARSNQNQSRVMDFPRKQPQKNVNIPASDQQLIAECEANHGARCSSAAEINYRRQLQRTPSPQEQASIQAAIQARRKREEDELRNRYFKR